MLKKFGSMSHEREAKLRKLDSLRRKVPAASQSALSQILKEIEKDGLPELRGRAHMVEARKLILDYNTSYGKIITTIAIPDEDGGALNVEFVKPFPWLCFVYEGCSSIRELIQAVHSAKPSTPTAPWNIILYTGEVTPQNPLAADLSKKVQAMYWSFAEFGPRVLCRENAWFVLTVHRSSLCKTLEGGLARLVGEGLKQLFVGPQTF